MTTERQSRLHRTDPTARLAIIRVQEDAVRDHIQKESALRRSVKLEKPFPDSSDGLKPPTYHPLPKDDLSLHLLGHELTTATELTWLQQKLAHIRSEKGGKKKWDSEDFGILIRYQELITVQTQQHRELAERKKALRNT